MLSKKEIDSLHKCMISDHALIDLEYIHSNDEIQGVVEKSVNGFKLSVDEFSSMPQANSQIQIKISDSESLIRLVSLSMCIGRDLQSLFETRNFSYLSLFIDPADMRIQDFFLIHVKKKFPEFWNIWTSGYTDEVLISFPENSLSK